MLVHTCDTRTYAPVGRRVTLTGTTARFTPHRNYTGKHKGSRHRTKSGDADAPRHSGGTQKSRAELTAPPMGTARGPRADPAKPASHAPRLSRAATKRTPNLPAGDSRAAGREPRGAARGRRSAFATSPSGSVEARRGRVNPPRSPLSARPGRPRRGAYAPHRHRAASPEARPPRLRRPHQKATCQRLSEPRDDDAAAVAPASAAPPLPSWLRPEVTSAGRPPPRHRPEAELVARDPSGPRQGSAA